MKIVEHDSITGISVERNATPDEIEAAEKALADMNQAAADAEAARQARRDPLRRLGLTEDEINTVLGL